MKRLRLKEQVTVLGRNYKGGHAYLRFTPTDKPGWWWKPSPRMNMVPINFSLVQSAVRRIVLRHNDATLNVIEHIMPLRMTGLDGICVDSSSWPPYHGRTLELWEALRQKCHPVDEPVAWCTLKDTVSASHPKDTTRRTVLSPSGRCSIEILISVDYPKIGSTNMIVALPDVEQLEMLFRVKSQGFPAWFYWPSKYVPQWLIPWRPHHDCLIWPQEMGESTISYFALHRALDLLGVLMLADHSRLLAVQVHSQKSGHMVDVLALRNAKLIDLAQS